MSFPIVRHRRLRRTAGIRNMVRETVLTVNDLIAPIFVTYGTNVREEIPSMPGVYHLSMDQLDAEIDEIVSLNIPSRLAVAVRKFC